MALKKQWYEIVAPEMFGSRVIGETLAAEDKSLLGRVIETSLLELMKNYQRFFVKLRFRVEKIEGGRVYTKFIGHACTSETAYRIVQRRTCKVDCIQDVVTEDGVKIKVSTVAVLSRRVKTSIKNSTRKFVREMISEYASGSESGKFIDSVIKGELQGKIRRACNRIYPLSNIEITKTKLY